MKIFHIIKSLGRGGAESLLAETLKVHDRNSFEFAYGYFLQRKNQFVPMLEEQGASVYCFATRNTPAMLLKTGTIARAIKDWNADIVHAHLPMSGVVARRAGKKANVPVVYTEHNVQERYHPLTRRANLWTMKQNARVLCVSDKVADSLKKHVRKKHHNLIQTVPNGVNTRAFSRERVKQLKRPKGLEQIDSEATVIGTVAVFRKQKRLDRWIDLAKKLDDRYKKLKFVLIGDGPEEDAVRRSIEEAGLSSKFHLPGRVDEVRPWLDRMDIFLMTSEHEGMPIAMLEAMSLERPVVATNAGGTGEVIESPEEGLVVSLNDSGALYQSVCRLIENESLRHSMGQAARERVVNAFSIERMARNLEDIYREIAAEYGI